MHTQSRKLTIIAGPNGAGKTTFAQTIYPDLIVQGHFLNADVFAQEMSPEDVGKSGVSAGKKLIHLLNDRLNHNQSILLETTLSGKSLLEKIKQAREKNFITRLIFLWISDVELCDFRVKGRVLPLEVIMYL